MKHNSLWRIAKRGNLILPSYKAFSQPSLKGQNPRLEDTFLLLLKVGDDGVSPETYYSAGKIVGMGSGFWNERLFVV